MQDILKTHQISSSVIDLIEESKELCYLVTPYLQIWPLLQRVLARAAQQEKQITFILRTEEPAKAHQRAQQVEQLNGEYGFEVIVLDQLHTKLYLNENRAIVSTMNLYDYSQRQNHELAVQMRSPGMVRKIKKEVIDEDLLGLTPRALYSGRFHSRVEALRSEMLDLQNQFESRGFCVSCGTKIDLDQGQITQPYVVRCRICWARQPDAAAAARELKISACHYCGEVHESILAQPYHHDCHATVKKFADWRKLNAVT